ncbi:MAG: MBL fold metallo-hydrolase [Actinomycetota bacterium]|nr:MBL fold metallo-hydrolase [Actinomycetota bacterium]
MASHTLAVDLARVEVEGRVVSILTWGSDVDLIERTAGGLKIRLVRHKALPDGTIQPIESVGVIPKPSKASKLSLDDVLVPREQNRVLKLDFVDVQQGDGSVIETPGGRVVLVDGGDNQLFARYLASRYRRTTAAAPKEIDAIVVTHGDADHFAGLTEIHASEANDNPLKKLFIRPRRVYHNGLVKRPAGVRKDRALGRTRKVGKVTLVTGLVDNLLTVADSQMNKPFLAWKRALGVFNGRGPIEFRRLERGDGDAFSFLADEGVAVEVLGPIPTRAGGVTGLKFLGEPRRGPRIGHPSVTRDRFVGKSVSHTINGHSIVLRLTYGDWRILYAGDLNEEAEQELLRDQAAGRVNLESDVLKVPHHGSADFSPEFFAAVRPVVSVVSSGDESARKEYIHPRATLMSALGKHARGAEPILLVTELVAFFDVEGWVVPEQHEDPRIDELDAHGGPKRRRKYPFFAFSRSAYGLVQLRTDGKRLLVSTNSGQVQLKEAYAYEMKDGEPVAVPVRQV